MTFLKAIPCVIWGLVKGLLVGGLLGLAGCLLGAMAFFFLSAIGVSMYTFLAGPKYILLNEPWKVFTAFSGGALAVIGFIWGATTGFRNMALRVDL